jgi:hypothetical protein
MNSAPSDAGYHQTRLSNTVVDVQTGLIEAVKTIPINSQVISMATSINPNDVEIRTVEWGAAGREGHSSEAVRLQISACATDTIRL